MLGIELFWFFYLKTGIAKEWETQKLVSCLRTGRTADLASVKLTEGSKTLACDRIKMRPIDRDHQFERGEKIAEALGSEPTMRKALAIESQKVAKKECSEQNDAETMPNKHILERSLPRPLGRQCFIKNRLAAQSEPPMKS